jgi:hypothetical protein
MKVIALEDLAMGGRMDRHYGVLGIPPAQEPPVTEVGRDSFGSLPSCHLTPLQPVQASSSRSLPSSASRSRSISIYLEPEGLRERTLATLSHITIGKFPTFEDQLVALCDVLPPRRVADRLIQVYREEVSWLCPALVWPVFEVDLPISLLSRRFTDKFCRPSMKNTGGGRSMAAGNQLTRLGWLVTRKILPTWQVGICFLSHFDSMVLCLAVAVAGSETREAFGDALTSTPGQASQSYFQVSEMALRLADYIRVPQLRVLQVRRFNCMEHTFGMTNTSHRQ